MRCNRFGTLLALAMMVALGDTAAAEELVGTWVPKDATPDVIAHQPQNARVLAIREAGGRLIGRLIVPGVTGIPLAVEHHEDHVRLVLQIARGMESPLEGTLSANQLSLGPPGDTNAPAVLRRASAEELVGSSRVDLQACKLEYSIVSPK